MPATNESLPDTPTIGRMEAWLYEHGAVDGPAMDSELEFCGDPNCPCELMPVARTHDDLVRALMAALKDLQQKSHEFVKAMPAIGKQAHTTELDALETASLAADAVLARVEAEQR